MHLHVRQKMVLPVETLITDETDMGFGSQMGLLVPVTVGLKIKNFIAVFALEVSFPCTALGAWSFLGGYLP